MHSAFVSFTSYFFWFLPFYISTDLFLSKFWDFLLGTLLGSSLGVMVKGSHGQRKRLVNFMFSKLLQMKSRVMKGAGFPAGARFLARGKAGGKEWTSAKPHAQHDVFFILVTGSHQTSQNISYLTFSPVTARQVWLWQVSPEIWRCQDKRRAGSMLLVWLVLSPRTEKIFVNKFPRACPFGKSFWQNIPHFFSASPSPGRISSLASLSSFYVTLCFPKMHTFVKLFMMLFRTYMIFIRLEYLSQNE